MNPDDLLRIAEGLARGALGSGMGRPRQAELRRAISAAYYAMFHALALCGANTLVGATREPQPTGMAADIPRTGAWTR